MQSTLLDRGFAGERPARRAGGAGIGAEQISALARPAQYRARGMSLGEAFRIALSGLAANKLRAFLTMLGIIIGVSTVIVMVAMGEGAAVAIQASIRKMGTNVLSVYPDNQKVNGVHMGLGTGQNLTPEDADTLRRKSLYAAQVAPEYRSGGVTVKHGDKNSVTYLYGTTPNYFEIRNLPLQEGRIFNQEEMKRRERVAVIGSEVNDELFNQDSPIGKTLKIKGQNFRVIGLIQERGGWGSRNPDDQVIVPLGTAMKRLFGATKLSGMSVEGVSGDRMHDLEDEIETIIAKAHHLPADSEPDVHVFNQQDLIDSAKAQSTALTMLLTGVALVSLIVGGIGIMNIMLVTVTERTREIGVRKALGAKRKDVLYQFLIESVTMSGVGGLIGVGIGVGTAIWMAMPQEMGGLHFPILLSITPIVVSFGVSALVGIFFGIYPAMKAASLDPIRALRHE